MNIHSVSELCTKTYTGVKFKGPPTSAPRSKSTPPKPFPPPPDPSPHPALTEGSGVVGVADAFGP